MSEAEIPNSPDPNENFLEADSIEALLASLQDFTAPSESSETDLSFEQALGLEAEAVTEVSVEPEETASEQNHQLLHRVAQLQQALEAAQTQIEQQQWRLREAEDLNAQQNDELNAAYEQNLSLSQELKNSRTKVQQQEEKITQMTHQLKVSQQRVAQLERECALIQKQFQEQSYKLCQAEKQSRELSFRLQQQRRHTWQFKSALNKCLEANPHQGDLETTPVASVPSEPIPAWSSQSTSVPAGEIETSAGETEEIEPTPETTDFEISLPQFEQTFMGHSEATPALRRSPSPMVGHPRKKRKSYAAVELPKFNC